LNLSHLVEDVTVTEHLRHRNELRVKIFTVKIKFFPWKECQETHHVNSPAIIDAITRLAAILKRDITMEYRRLEADLKGQIANIGKGMAANEWSADEEDSEGNEKEDREVSEVGDGDADEEKRKAQGQEQTTYDEEEGDDAEEDDGVDPIPTDEAMEAATDGEEESRSEDKGMDLDASQWKVQKGEIESAFTLSLPLVPDSLKFDETDGLRFELEVRQPSLPGCSANAISSAVRSPDPEDISGGCSRTCLQQMCCQRCSRN
jgi:DNA-directed RNA polymerase I subunit RPA1